MSMSINSQRKWSDHVLFDEREGYLCQPKKGVAPCDIRSWLNGNYDERNLAKALVNVWNKTSWMLWDLEEAKGEELATVQAIYAEWDSLLDELYNRALSILFEENLTGKANHNMEIAGKYFKLAPIMYRNGYKSDTNGGWKQMDIGEHIGEEDSLQHMMDSRVFFVSDIDDKIEQCCVGDSRRSDGISCKIAYIYKL